MGTYGAEEALALAGRSAAAEESDKGEQQAEDEHDDASPEEEAAVARVPLAKGALVDGHQAHGGHNDDRQASQLSFTKYPSFGESFIHSLLLHVQS